MVEIVAIGAILGVCYKLRESFPAWYALMAILAFLRGFVRGINKAFSAPPREEPGAVLPGESENVEANLPRDTLTRTQVQQRKQKIKQGRVFMDDTGEVTFNGMAIGDIDQTATGSQFCPRWHEPCPVHSSPEAAWHDATDYAEIFLERR